MKRLLMMLFLLPTALVYTANAVANESQEVPAGLFGPRVRDFISRKPTLSPHETCGSPMACSIVAAIASCDCRFDTAANGILARTSLRLLGTIYYFQGPFASIAKRPRDRSVVDRATAIRHEYAYHITPAVLSVAGLMADVESRSFPTMADCIRAGRELAQAVTSMFRETLIATQDRERKR